MGTALIILGAICAIGGVVSLFIIMMDAFESELWQGLLCLFFWPYMLWYMFAEFDHNNRWLVILTALFGCGIGGLLVGYGMMMNNA